MKTIKVEHGETKVTLEMSLKEMELLRDISGAFSAKEVRGRVSSRMRDTDLVYKMFALYDSLNKETEKIK